MKALRPTRCLSVLLIGYVSTISTTAFSVCMSVQGEMLQALHSHLLNRSMNNLHAHPWAQMQQHLASEPADDADEGGGRSTAAVNQDTAAICSTMHEVLDKKLWPLEALMNQAVGEYVCPVHTSSHYGPLSACLAESSMQMHLILRHSAACLMYQIGNSS